MDITKDFFNKKELSELIDEIVEGKCRYVVRIYKESSLLEHNEDLLKELYIMRGLLAVQYLLDCDVSYIRAELWGEIAVENRLKHLLNKSKESKL